MPAEATASLPERIGRYRILALLGRGGMGTVYLAADETLGREVAIKTLNAALDEEDRSRFLVEARAAARLSHPNIVTIFDLGEEAGVPFIAMELLSGVDLHGLMRSGEEILLAEKLDFVMQACQALGYAHEHGIVHRDIKPGNLWVSDDGTIKVLDFGVAQLGTSQITRPGMTVGTVSYLSPEQATGQRVDGRSDVFSLGVILYELLAGRRPFEGDSIVATIYQIFQGVPPPLEPSAALEEWQPRLQQIVARALAKKPEERYPSGPALAADISAVLSEIAQRGKEAAASDATEEIAAAQRLLKEGQVADAERRLTDVVAAHPRSVPARRALRAARRANRLAHRGKAAPGEAPVIDGPPVRPLAEFTGLTRAMSSLDPPTGNQPAAQSERVSRATLSRPGQRHHVFLCYRREDTADISGRLADHLVRRLGPKALFRDIDSVPLGANFKTYLESVVGDCFVALVVIGRKWLEATDETGRKRLDDPRDWVRIEIEAALNRDIPIIPLLVHGAAVPRPDQLPESLRELAFLQGAAVRTDPDFSADVRRLVDALSKLLPPRPRR